MVVQGKTRQLVAASLLVAMGVILPLLFHSVPKAGSIFLPMHIPVLIAGLILGWKWGLLVGAITPLIASILTGMPPLGYLPAMLIELAVYGFVAGLLVELVNTNKDITNIYISLVGAMLAGRIVAGIAKAVYFRVGDYSLPIWITSSFITALPGVIIQIVLIPILVAILRKTNFMKN